MRTKRQGDVLEGPIGVVASRVVWATTFGTRARGIIGRPRLTEDDAVILVPCRRVHTFGVGYAIDAVFCDEEMRVVDVQTLPPASVSRRVAGATLCVELAAGRAERCGITKGTRLVLRETV